MSEKKVQVKVRSGMFMPLPNGGNAEGGDEVSIPESYLESVRYMVEPLPDEIAQELAEESKAKK